MAALPTNTFKQGRAERGLQVGYWMGLDDPGAAEICAGAGSDWLMMDAEHGINAAGKCAGSLATDPDTARQFLDFSTLFLAVGSDIGTLRSQTVELAKAYKDAK